MGSWNGTCCISTLPIKAGEKVKVVILHKPYGNADMLNMAGFCYSTGILCPAFYPLDGEYDDYGGVENLIQDWNYDIINQTIRKQFKAIEVEGERLDEFSVENILEGIERNSLRTLSELTGDIYKIARNIMAMEDYPNKDEWKKIAETDTSEQWRPSNFSFVMIRKDVWDHICAKFQGEFWKDAEDRLHPHDYYQTVKEYCTKQFSKAVDKSVIDELDSMHIVRILRRASSVFSIRGEGGFLLSEDEYNDYLFSDNIDKESVFNAYFEVTSIASFLSITRKSWMPQAGAGSQSQEWKEYKILTDIINKICDEHIQAENSDEDGE